MKYNTKTDPKLHKSIDPIVKNEKWFYPFNE